MLKLNARFLEAQHGTHFTINTPRIFMLYFRQPDRTLPLLSTLLNKKGKPVLVHDTYVDIMVARAPDGQPLLKEVDGVNVPEDWWLALYFTDDNHAAAFNELWDAAHDTTPTPA